MCVVVGLKVDEVGGRGPPVVVRAEKVHKALLAGERVRRGRMLGKGLDQLRRRESEVGEYMRGGTGVYVPGPATSSSRTWPTLWRQRRGSSFFFFHPGEKVNLKVNKIHAAL